MLAGLDADADRALALALLVQPGLRAVELAVSDVEPLARLRGLANLRRLELRPLPWRGLPGTAVPPLPAGLTALAIEQPDPVHQQVGPATGKGYTEAQYH